MSGHLSTHLSTQLATQLANLSARQLQALFTKGEVSAVEITEAHLEATKNANVVHNAFTEITDHRMRQQAKSIDSLSRKEATALAFCAVPYAVKNLFDVEGVTTLAGSKVYAISPKATRDAYLVDRLNTSGGLLAGCLNMDEFAYGFTTENSHYGPSRNAWDRTRIGGGSSGGSAVAVASGMVPISLGSDTNGSIRVPASLNGIYGLKPTFGRLSRRGTFPFVASLDHLGPFARDIHDLALAYNTMQGIDKLDPAFAAPSIAPIDFTSLDGHFYGLGSEPLRVARLTGYFDANAGPYAIAASKLAASLLGASDEVEMPHAALGRAAAFLITNAEGGALHTPWLRTHQNELEPLSVDRFIAGALSPAQWYLKAQRYRRRFRDEALKLFHKYDLLIAPATPVSAPVIGTEWIEVNGQKMPCRPAMGILTQPISFIGLPVVVAPHRSITQTMPIGVQIIAPPWREDLAFAAAAALEAKGFSANCVLLK
jgi:AtzE family amidohydrolase